MLEPAIRDVKDVISKSIYLHYRDVNALATLAEYFYFRRFAEKDKYFIIQLINDTQLIKYTLQNSKVGSEEMKTHFVSWLNASPLFEQKSNILDVLLLNYKNDTEVQAIYKNMRWGGKKGRGIGDDDQSAHDEDITEASLIAAENLIAWGKKNSLELDPHEFKNPREWSKSYLYSKFKGQKERTVIDKIIERCAVDTTLFGSGFSIGDIFYTTLNYIRTSKTKEKNLLAILMDEMVSMADLCTSGYVNRFITALQGTDPAFSVNVSEKKRLLTIISYKIQKDSVSMSDNASLGTIDPKYKRDYLTFVQDCVNKHLAEILDSTDEKIVSECISEVLSSITEHKFWTYKDRKISYDLPGNE
jgi:hypothetical protein